MPLTDTVGLTARYAASKLYEAVQRSWAWAHAVNALKNEKAPMPVISVGAIAIGGSGKTPLTMLLGDRLKRLGYRPVICSRGYKGSYRGVYEFVADGHSGRVLVGPEVSGDEPFLMASRLKNVPVVVARKRIYGIRASNAQLNCDVAILDDGFQHLALFRDFNIVLLKSGMDWMFPRGTLREPFKALNRADAILLEGESEKLPNEVCRYINKKPVFKIQQQADCVIHGLDNEQLNLAALEHLQVYLASGIANPKRFEAMAHALDWKVTNHSVFNDHYKLSDDDFKEIISKSGDQPIVLTEKDWVKAPEWFRTRSNSFCLRIKLYIENENEFIQLVTQSIQRHESRQ